MKKIFEQFGHPRGALGWLVGHAMALKNGARSRWALDLLAPRPLERICEIGFGPGVDVRRMARAVGRGLVAGVDVSSEMLRQARARNRAGERSGRVDLRLGSAIELPFEDRSFDAVYATNSAQFWPDLDRGMREVRRVLRPGGRAVIVVQPMWRGATDEDALKWRDRLRYAMETTGFLRIGTEQTPLAPVLAVAAIGRA